MEGAASKPSRGASRWLQIWVWVSAAFS